MRLLNGDCLIKLRELESESVDLVYLDPPFFSQKTHALKTKDNSKEYSFEDKWESIEDYKNFIQERLVECHRVLKNTGSIFLHCDKSASHYLRMALDAIFGYDNFQSEIIWSYKRWSNSKKGLLNNHQTIYFYSKSKKFKFNTIYTDYSLTTNIDQILQDRERDENRKSVYKKNENGEVVLGKGKKGVPLSDVWEIPYLNPKAKERVGYPTQKPILLLEQIISIATDEGDIVLDPFVGSGTTMVSAYLLNRRGIGIDISEDAIELTQKRLDTPIKTESSLLKKGKDKYKNLTDEQMRILSDIDAVPVQRNTGIDGFLKEHLEDGPVSIRIQREGELLEEAKDKLLRSSKKKSCSLMILIRTQKDSLNGNILLGNIYNEQNSLANRLLIIDSYDIQINRYMNNIKHKDNRGEVTHI